MIRAFIAIDVRKEELIRKIEEIKRDFSKYFVGKFVEPENLHLTIKFLGEIDRTTLNNIIKEIKKLEYDSFDITLKGVGTFSGGGKPRVLWIGVIDKEGKLRDLARKIWSISKGIGDESKEFKPHLTIARIKFIKNLEMFSKTLEKYLNEKVGVLRVDELKIKKSTLTPNGPIYEDIYVHKLKKC